MANRLSISMQKGGVGKSTTTINLGGALANENTPGGDQDVLIVDADPQGFITITMGLREYYVSDQLSLHDVITDIDRFDEVNDLIVEHEEFDVVPSHGANFQLERELWSLNRTQERLRMVLDRIHHDYDYILIDSPPNMGPLADGAILAAENVLFVSRADPIATFSMNLLTQEIDQLEREFQTTIGILGAVVNAVSQNNISNERLEWFHNHIGEDHTFTIPETVAIEGAFDQGRSIFTYDAENRHRAKKADEIREIYTRLATKMEEYFE